MKWNEYILEESNEECYLFQNSDGKRWLMPSKNIRIAMALYQPSGLKGKMLKAIFPLVKNMRFIHPLFHAERYGVSINRNLHNLFQKVFCSTDLEYSIFFGSPGPRQKITIQIFNQEKIFGYAKISDNDEIIKNFKHEARFLKYLSDKGIVNIPIVPFCGKYEDYYVFIQTTEKTVNSRSDNHIEKHHIYYATNLFEKTKKIMPYNESGLNADISYLKSISTNFKKEDWCILEKGINIIEAFFQGDVELGAIHGDFTPWNTYIKHGDLYTFDYEYAGFGYPAYLDILHFALQIGILVKNISELEAFNLLQRVAKKIPVEKYRELIISYLLREFSLYSRLFDGRFCPNDRSYRMWIGLINRYSNYE